MKVVPFFLNSSRLTWDKLRQDLRIALTLSRFLEFSRRLHFSVLASFFILLLGKVLVDGMEKLDLKLHDYQRELVQPLLDGKNTIICAPTGSGKTFVAMEAIKRHVTLPNRKSVAFIVNTVSLVEQQESCLQRYLPESVDVSSLCGSNPDVSLASFLEDNHVVVLTAQVLVNALEKDKEETGAGVAQEKEVTISQFSLLVFDECHHTNKDHPYNEIMRWYMRTKFEVGTSLVSLTFVVVAAVVGR